MPNFQLELQIVYENFEGIFLVILISLYENDLDLHYNTRILVEDQLEINTSVIPKKKKIRKNGSLGGEIIRLLM